MQIRPKNGPSWADFAGKVLHQWFAGLRHERFWNTQTRHVTSAMAGKHAVRSLGLDELDLDDRRTRLIHARYTPARHRLQGEQRHGCGAVASGGG